jgi:hypothetical protein
MKPYQKPEIRRNVQIVSGGHKINVIPMEGLPDDFFTSFEILPKEVRGPNYRKKILDRYRNVV